MADSSQQNTVAVAFAPPPPLWKHFTRENLDRFEQIKIEASKDHDGKPNHNKKWTPEELRKLEVPPELRFLVPPDVPTDQYSVFGELQPLSTTLPSLQDQGINQLYPEPTKDATADSTQPSQPLNHAYYLLKISKSLLLNFLEFVGILSVSPEQFESKVEDIRNLFINAHHLLNLYRPHQSRESLITMMEEQLERTKDDIQQMDKLKTEIEGVLNELQAEGSQASLAEPKKDATAHTVTDSQEVKTKDSRLVWDLINREV